METLNHPACTVGLVARLGCCWLSSGKATCISHGRNPNGTVKLLNIHTHTRMHAQLYCPRWEIPFGAIWTGCKIKHHIDIIYLKIKKIQKKACFGTLLYKLLTYHPFTSHTDDFITAFSGLPSEVSVRSHKSPPSQIKIWRGRLYI